MPQDFTLRVATPADEAGVTALLEASYPPLMRPSYDQAVLAPALVLMTQASAVLLASGTYHLAKLADGRLVGCGGWTRERPGSGEVEPGLAHIRHFGTHPDWLGRGIGRALYARCEAEARAAGLCRFECQASLNAEGFYDALGFAAVRRIEVPIGPGPRLPGVLMTRAI